ncbi:MAG: transporter substrate-binding domain-containing protein [Coxiellaceae bacterium]|nr:transporter substrate-binding domain-containing protein [Coxiellaceae bacterium]
MKFRLWIGLLLTSFFLIGFAETAKPISVVETKHFDLPAIIKRGYIISAMYPRDLPPFVSWSHGKPFGLSVDLTDKFARILGVKVKYYTSAANFDNIVLAVSEHKADMSISMLTRSTHRAISVAFTTPYLSPDIWLLVSRLQFAGLTDKQIVAKVLMPNQYSYVTYPKSEFSHLLLEYVHHRAKFIVKTTQEKIDAIAEHKADMCIIDALSGGYWLGKNPSYLISVRPIKMPYIHDPLSIAVPYDAPILLSTLNVFVDTMRMNGYMDRLTEAYFSKAVTLGKK